MKIREKIYEEIKNMGLDELSILYEQIKLIEKINKDTRKKDTVLIQ